MKPVKDVLVFMENNYGPSGCAGRTKNSAFDCLKGFDEDYCIISASYRGKAETYNLYTLAKCAC